MRVEAVALAGLMIFVTVVWMLGLPSVLSHIFRTAIQPKTSGPPVMKPIGFSLWFRLFLATALGGGIGLFMSYMAPYIVGLDPFEGLGSFLLGGLWGGFMGALQYRVLRDYLPQANDWIWANVIGWAVGVGISLNGVALISETSISWLLLPVVGITVGLAQWFLLRHIRRHALWWIPMNSIGWMTSLAIAWWVSYPVLEREGHLLPYILWPWTMGMAMGVIGGVFTATAMLWLLRQPPLPIILPKRAG